MQRKPINIDDLQEGAYPLDQFGFPILPPAPAEVLHGSTLSEMTNDFSPVRGKFWTKAPKLRQQKRVTAISARLQGIADPVAIMDAITETACLFLYVEDGENMRPATADEVDDEFDLAEVQALVGQMTGMKLSEGEPKNS